MLSNDFWWPLDLSPPEDAAVRGFYRLVAENPPPLDLPLLMGSVDLLAALMTRHVCDIIDRDGLPHLCHVINGWGNAVCRGQRLWDRMAAFIHRDEQGRPAILQRDPEGEYHPWQSFAYAVMAGVGPDDPIPPDGVTLRTLSQNSRILNTQAGHELGHLLFALAYLDPALEGPPFALLDAEASASDLVDAAIEAHHRGSFEVCRKFHLTEGVCAMAALVPSLRHHRRTAQGFLDGQMDILFVLGTILWEVRRAADSAQSPPLMASLKNSENHSSLETSSRTTSTTPGT